MSNTSSLVRANYREYVYADICEDALKVQKKYKLDSLQLNLYNYLCRGDFALENDDGVYLFVPSIDRNYSCTNREYIQKVLQPLLDSGLVAFTKIRSDIDKRRTNWFFHDSRYALSDLITDWQVSPYGASVIKAIKSAKDSKINVEFFDFKASKKEYESLVELTKCKFGTEATLDFSFLGVDDSHGFCSVVPTNGSEVVINNDKQFMVRFWNSNYCTLQTKPYSKDCIEIKFRLKG